MGSRSREDEWNMIEVCSTLWLEVAEMRDKTPEWRTETERQNNHVLDFWNGRLCNNRNPTFGANTGYTLNNLHLSS